MVISFRLILCTSRQRMAMRIEGMKNEEREKWKRIESKEGATRHTLRWIFQKRNYKSRLKTRGEVIKRNLYETQRVRGSSLKGKK